jgi:perosamine synthetase
VHGDSAVKGEQRIPVARPLLGQPEVDAAARAILSGWVTQGPEVAAFEREFAEAVGSTHACALSNCTVALHLALRAVGVRAGDEVITVSHSFIATANAVRYCGATPVFVDVRPDTYNIDPRCIEGAIGTRTRAILVVHQLGMPCDMAAVCEIASRHGLPVVEDAACAIGSEILVGGEWERIGRPHGDIACFSFHPRKIVTTGDGGMVTTRNPEYDEQIRLWRQHGMTVSDTVRHSANRIVLESYETLGYNYRMTDIQAAVGRAQLARLSGLVGERRLLAHRFASLLSSVPGLRVPVEAAWARSNWQSYCVGLPDGVDQIEVMQGLLDRGVSSRRGVMCAHTEPAYASEPWRSAGTLVESERAAAHSIILPLYPLMTRDDQERVVRAVAEVCSPSSHGRAVPL